VSLRLYIAAAAALLLVLCIGASAAEAGSPPTSCLSGGTVDIDWPYAHHNPSYGTGVYAPDGCWSWNDFSSQTGTWGVCRWNNGSGSFSGSRSNIAYDDTDDNHTGGLYGSENSLIYEYCLGGSSYLNVEEEAPDSNCPNTTTYVERDTGFTVGVFLKELYCGQNYYRDYGNGSCPSPSTSHGCMINAGADVPAAWGGPCQASVSTCQSNMNADFQNACANYASKHGYTLGIYGGYAITTDSERTTIADWINADINADCFVQIP
jgi:hypothetical protein